MLIVISAYLDFLLYSSDVKSCLKKACKVDRDCEDARLSCHPGGFCTGKTNLILTLYQVTQQKLSVLNFTFKNNICRDDFC